MHPRNRKVNVEDRDDVEQGIDPRRPSSANAGIKGPVNAMKQFARRDDGDKKVLSAIEDAGPGETGAFNLNEKA